LTRNNTFVNKKKDSYLDLKKEYPMVHFTAYKPASKRPVRPIIGEKKETMVRTVTDSLDKLKRITTFYPKRRIKTKAKI
jgi:hypothetical protein